MKSILDPTFRYTSSVHTDLRKTFARLRREKKEADARAAADQAEREAKVRALTVERTDNATLTNVYPRRSHA